MSVVTTIITIVLLIVAVLLIVTVLMQKSNNGGAGAAFGSETTSFTARGKAASRDAQLRKLTIILAAIIGVLAIVLSILG